MFRTSKESMFNIKNKTNQSGLSQTVQIALTAAAVLFLGILDCLFREGNTFILWILTI